VPPARIARDKRALAQQTTTIEPECQ